MTDLEVTEGHVPLDAGVDKPCQTYWKKVTSSAAVQGPALVVVHGGPTFGHQYLLSLRAFARRGAHSSVIFYDQLGCGNSSFIPEKKNDSSFWKLELLRKELYNLIQHLADIAPEAQGRYDLFGHSCGALLSCFLAADPPPGLRKLVLSNGMASLGLLNEAVPAQLDQYPPDVRQKIIEREEYALGRRAESHVSMEEYQAALTVYRNDYVMRITGPMPEELLMSYQVVQSARDSFRGFAGGDVQMIYGGSLEKEDAIPVLPRITVPALVLNGEHDKASSETSEPLWKLIPRAQRVVMSGTSHFPFYEDLGRYLSIIGAFLES